MRLRLSDATTSAVLAAHYREQAEMCHSNGADGREPFQRGLAGVCCRVDEVGAGDRGKSRARTAMIESVMADAGEDERVDVELGVGPARVMQSRWIWFQQVQ